MGNEEAGAKRVNFYLETFFRCNFLSLKVIEKTSEDRATEGMPKGSHFEIIRNKKKENSNEEKANRNEEKANNLSEGEGNLIAFCYFMATLEKTNTKDTPPIIWIDDPVSSLDSNHIFSIYSLIKYTFFPYEESENRVGFEQLFISTHSLKFLKYLTRLPNKKEKKESPNEKEKKESPNEKEKKESPNEKEKKAYFLIERWGDSSAIKKMPDHLKSGTEFTYLFAQLYECANPEEKENTSSIYYNFGNNMRKFLETYLYYKYPDEEDPVSMNNLKKFFGELEAIRINRIINEYSHAKGAMEEPFDGAEVKEVAELIIDTIKGKDKAQYKALCKSFLKENSSVSPALKNKILREIAHA